MALALCPKLHLLHLEVALRVELLTLIFQARLLHLAPLFHLGHVPLATFFLLHAAPLRVLTFLLQTLLVGSASRLADAVLLSLRRREDLRQSSQKHLRLVCLRLHGTFCAIRLVAHHPLGDGLHARCRVGGQVNPLLRPLVVLGAKPFTLVQEGVFEMLSARVCRFDCLLEHARHLGSVGATRVVLHLRHVDGGVVLVVHDLGSLL